LDTGVVAGDVASSRMSSIDGRMNHYYPPIEEEEIVEAKEKPVVQKGKVRGAEDLVRVSPPPKPKGEEAVDIDTLEPRIDRVSTTVAHPVIEEPTHEVVERRIRKSVSRTAPEAPPPPPPIIAEEPSLAKEKEKAEKVRKITPPVEEVPPPPPYIPPEEPIPVERPPREEPRKVIFPIEEEPIPIEEVPPPPPPYIPPEEGISPPIVEPPEEIPPVEEIPEEGGPRMIMPDHREREAAIKRKVVGEVPTHEGEIDTKAPIRAVRDRITPEYGIPPPSPTTTIRRRAYLPYEEGPPEEEKPEEGLLEGIDWEKIKEYGKKYWYVIAAVAGLLFLILLIRG